MPGNSKQHSTVCAYCIKRKTVDVWLKLSPSWHCNILIFICTLISTSWKLEEFWDNSFLTFSKALSEFVYSGFKIQQTELIEPLPYLNLFIEMISLWSYRPTIFLMKNINFHTSLDLLNFTTHSFNYCSMVNIFFFPCRKLYRNFSSVILP